VSCICNFEVQDCRDKCQIQREFTEPIKCGRIQS